MNYVTSAAGTAVRCPAKLMGGCLIETPNILGLAGHSTKPNMAGGFRPKSAGRQKAVRNSNNTIAVAAKVKPHLMLSGTSLEHRNFDMIARQRPFSSGKPTTPHQYPSQQKLAGTGVILENAFSWHAMKVP